MTKPEAPEMVEYDCGRTWPLLDAADVEPVCDACGASLAAAVSIAPAARVSGALDRLNDRLNAPQPSFARANGAPEVPEGFVSDRPWLDENVLLFDRRARSDVR